MLLKGWDKVMHSRSCCLWRQKLSVNVLDTGVSYLLILNVVAHCSESVHLFHGGHTFIWWHAWAVLVHVFKLETRWMLHTIDLILLHCCSTHLGKVSHWRLLYVHCTCLFSWMCSICQGPVALVCSYFAVIVIELLVLSKVAVVALIS